MRAERVGGRGMKKRASKSGGSRAGKAPRQDAPNDPAPPKPFRPRPVAVYFTEERLLDLLHLLRQKWYNEGKIPEPKVNLAIMHMLRNFGDIAQRAPADNGSLPLDPVRRQKFAVLKQAFQVAGATPGAADYDALAYAIDYLYEAFKDERLLQRFIEARGRLRHG